MKLYGVLGHPVSHSRSPAMHNRAFSVLELAAVYVAFDVSPERLPDAMRGVRALGISGLNVTLPHKSAIMPLLDEVDAVAREIGAVNTVLRDGDRLLGTNTDAEGLCRALREAGIELPGLRVTVLGAGGAARASVVGLARAGVRSVTIAARSRERSEALVAELVGLLAPVTLHAADFEPSSLRAAFGQTDLLVQATSATLGDGPAADHFANLLPLAALPRAASVIDLVYRPLETTVLRAANALGHPTVDGLGMLLHQGGLAFERWTGRAAPLAEMRAALL
jgi:shikimate dehydrogenase